MHLAFNGDAWAEIRFEIFHWRADRRLPNSDDGAPSGAPPFKKIDHRANRSNQCEGDTDASYKSPDTCLYNRVSDQHNKH